MVASRRSDRRIVGVAAGLLAVPALVLLVRAARATWVPSSDWAAIEARTRDVWTSHASLVGPYSRYGWNHPGPLLFYVLAVPYRLLGSQPHGLFVGVALDQEADASGDATRRRCGRLQRGVETRNVPETSSAALIA